MVIFDILAVNANDKYGIVEDEKDASLNRKRKGRKFWEKLEQEDSRFKQLSKDYKLFLKISYKIRNLLIHRQGFKKGGYSSREFSSHIIRLNDSELGDEIRKKLPHLGDSEREGYHTTEWGLHALEDHEIYDLVPYHFFRRIVEECISFTDEFLEILGYENSIEERDKNSKYHENLDNIMENGLTTLVESKRFEND